MKNKDRKKEQKGLQPVTPSIRIGQSRATQKCPMDPAVRKCKSFARRVAARLMSRGEFIERHASGTLRKNLRLSMDCDGQYLHERVAFEFGYGFEAVHETRVTWGTPISFGDCKPVTEAGWFFDRYVEVSAFPGDEFSVKYIMVEYPDGSRREGLGIVVRKTSATFVPEKHMVFAIIAQWSTKKNKFKGAVNPC